MNAINSPQLAWMDKYCFGILDNKIKIQKNH